MESSAHALRTRRDKRNRLVDEITEEIREELKRQMRRSWNEDEKWLKSLVQTPLTRRIIEVSPPSKVSFPYFVLFNRMTDTNDHIVRYHDTMITFEIPRDKLEAMLCKLFLTSLIGHALSWYHSLQSGSIQSLTN